MHKAEPYATGRSDSPAVVFDGFFDGVVLFGEAHQLQADGVDEGFPTGVDDVLADADGAPTAAVVAPLDEDADIGGRAFAGIEDADFVIGEADVGDLRIEPGKALAQADVQGVEGAVPGFGGAVNIVLRPDRDGGGGSGGVGGGPGRDLVAFDVEEMQTGAEGFANEQLEGAFGGFELVAFVLHLLDALEELAAGVLFEAVGEAVLLELIDDIAAAGEVADEDALAVADELGLDVLVGGGVLEDGADVHAALVGEGAFTDEGLVVAQRKVGQLGDEPADAGETGEFIGADGGVVELELEVGDDTSEIGVAAALAVAVHAALYVSGASFDSGQGVGDGEIAIVVDVDADDAVETRADFGDDFGEARGDGAAVGVAEAEDIGAGSMGGLQGAEGVIGIGDVAVEEVLGIVNELLAVVLDVADGLGDEDEVLVVGDAEGAFDVEVPGLAEDGDDGGAGFDEGADVAVLMDGVLGEAGAAEGGQPGVVQGDPGSALEELLVFGVAARPAPLNVINT